MSARIIIVENHVAFRSDLKDFILLLDAEYQVVAAVSTAAEAFSQIPMLEPDIVLMDIELPDMNGLAATRSIHERWPRIGVIVISNNPAGAYRPAALRAGAITYIDKMDLAEALPDALSAATRPPGPPGAPHQADSGSTVQRSIIHYSGCDSAAGSRALRPVTLAEQVAADLGALRRWWGFVFVATGQRARGASCSGQHGRHGALSVAEGVNHDDAGAAGPTVPDLRKYQPRVTHGTLRRLT